MPEVYKHDRKAKWPGLAALLYGLALPPLVALIVALIFPGSWTDLLGLSGAIASIVFAARSMKAGLRAEAEFRKHKLARAPRTPRKLIGSLLTGLAGFSFWWGLGRPLEGVVVGAISAVAAMLFYGLDPRSDKAAAAAGSHGYTTDEILAALTEAEDKIKGIERAARNIRNPELTTRLKRIARRARNIVSVMEEDPADIRRARRFLNVYLDGAKRVSEGYARTHSRRKPGDLEGNFRNVLTTIEDVFDQQHQKLLEHDQLDLDVQIDVLSQQLKKQGVT